MRVLSPDSVAHKQWLCLSFQPIQAEPGWVGVENGDKKASNLDVPAQKNTEFMTEHTRQRPPAVSGVTAVKHRGMSSFYP